MYLFVQYSPFYKAIPSTISTIAVHLKSGQKSSLLLGVVLRRRELLHVDTLCFVSWINFVQTNCPSIKYYPFLQYCRYHTMSFSVNFQSNYDMAKSHQGCGNTEILCLSPASYLKNVTSANLSRQNPTCPVLFKHLILANTVASSWVSGWTFLKSIAS